MEVFDFIITQILGDATVLFALLTLIGFLVQKRSVSDIIAGVAKTIIGFEILNAGCGVITVVCDPIAAMVSSILNVEGIQPNLWAAMSVGMAEFGFEVGLTFVLAFILNIFLARVTPLKGVQATGHIMLLITCWVVPVFGGYGLTGVTLIVASVIACALQFWITTSIMYFFMKKHLTDDYSLCMPNLVGVAFASFFARFFGTPEDSCENINVSENLQWVKDSVVTVGVLSSIIWLILGIIAGGEVVQPLAGSVHWTIYLIKLGFKFSGAITIITLGVRMMLSEVVVALNALTDRFVPGAVLGLDYPTIFQFSPTAVFLGFFGKLLGAMLGTVAMAAMGWQYVVLPSVYMDFWDGALVGVFADKVGGRRAVFVLPFVYGFLLQLGYSLGFGYSGDIFLNARLLIDYPDFFFLGPVLSVFGKLFGV